MDTFAATLKNLTVGDVHVSSALEALSTAYTQDDVDDDEARTAEQMRRKPKKKSLAFFSEDHDVGTFLQALGRAEVEDLTSDPIRNDQADREMERFGKVAEVKFTLHVSKLFADKRQVFGWASVSAIDGELIIDKQDDIIPMQELEKAAHDFALYSRAHGSMHDTIGTGRLIESTIHSAERRKCGIVAKDEMGRVIDGWFVGFQIDDDGVWASCKSGDRPEFSIGGQANWDDA